MRPLLGKRSIEFCYPTAYALQGLWALQIAERNDWDWEHPSGIQELLDRVTPNDILDPALWEQPYRLVVIEPDGGILPTSEPANAVAWYEGRGCPGRARGHGIGLDPRSGETGSRSGVVLPVKGWGLPSKRWD